MNRTAAPEVEQLSPEAEARANARVASMPFLQGAQITMPEEPPAAGIGAETPTAAETQATPQRATPVRGTCAICGKHASRHKGKDHQFRVAPGAKPEQAPIYIELPALRFDVSTVLGRDMLSHLVASGANFGSGMDWAIMEQLLNHIDRLSEGTRKPEAK